MSPRKGAKELPTMRLEIIQDGKNLQANSEQGEGKKRNGELLARDVGKGRRYPWVIGILPTQKSAERARSSPFVVASTTIGDPRGAWPPLRWLHLLFLMRSLLPRYAS